MTAVNIILQRHTALLFCDTKATTAEGLQYHTIKQAAFPWMRTVLAVRGYVGALRVFERAIAANAGSYDKAVQFLLTNFQKMLDADYIDETEAFAMKQNVDVYLVGWGVSGPSAHWISDYRTGGKIQKIDGIHVSPKPDFEAQKAFAADPKAGMQALMGAQAALNPTVGGFILVTEVHEDHMVSYPLGGICDLHRVASRWQPQEEKDRIAAIEAANAERVAKVAVLGDINIDVDRQQ